MKRSALLVFAVAVILAGSVLYGTNSGSRKDMGVVSSPESGLVEALDRVIQKRFGDITEEDIKEGKFGIRRITGLSELHPMIFPPETRDEQLAVHQLREAGWFSAFYVIGLKKSPASTANIKVVGPIFAADAHWPVKEDMSAIGALATCTMTDKTAHRCSGTECFLEARPVLVSSRKCLPCHRSTAMGEPIGAVVYAFRRGTTP